MLNTKLVYSVLFYQHCAGIETWLCANVQKRAFTEPEKGAVETKRC